MECRILGNVRRAVQILDDVSERLPACEVRPDLRGVAPRPALLAPQLRDPIDADPDVPARVRRHREALGSANADVVVLALGHLYQTILVRPAEPAGCSCS